jgi:hypothetical protein
MLPSRIPLQTKKEDPKPPQTPSSEKPADKPPASLASVIAERTKVIESIKSIEAKGNNASDIERFAIEAMRAKLSQIDSQFGTLADVEVTVRLHGVASTLVKEGVITEASQYMVSLTPGEDPTVKRLGAKQAAKADGEKGTKRKFGWDVDGKTEETGATLIVKAISDATTLVRGEYKPADVLGICARKGWKVAASLGPVSIRQQGKVVEKDPVTGKAIKWEPYPIVADEKHTITLAPDKSKGAKLGAHKHALIAEAKHRDGDAVKWAIGYLADMIGDEGRSDGAIKHKKVTADELIKYMSSLHANASKAHAAQIVD